MRARLLQTCVLFLLSATIAEASDTWPQFRGPDGSGHAGVTNPPTDFSRDGRTLWNTPIPGLGWSSPTVQGNTIWLTTAVSKPASAEKSAARLKDDPLASMKEVVDSVQLMALRMDATNGKILQSIPLATIGDPAPINPLNSYASPTPLLADGKVICHFGNNGTWCLDAETGETLWKIQMVVDHSVGPGSSPIIVQGVLVLVCDGTDQQFIAGIDPETGNELWRTKRPPMRASNPEYQKSYCTPAAVTVAGTPQIVVPGAQWVCGYEPKSGKEIWRLDHGEGFSLCCRPIVKDDLLIFTTGYMRPELVAVRCDGQGDVTQSHLAWRVSRGAPSKPSPIIDGQSVVMVSDQGVLTRVSIQDGNIEWQKRLAGNYSASPIMAGDKLYFCSHEGVVTVLQSGSEFHQLAENQLSPRILASPAVIDNDLLIRTEQGIQRIGRSE